MIREELMVRQQQFNVLGGILSPVSDSYGKSSLINEQDRFEMCRLATEDISWLGVSKVEINQGIWVETKLIFDQLQQAFNRQWELAAESAKFDYSLIAPPPSCSATNTKPFPTTSPRMIFCMGSDVFLGFAKPHWWSYSDVEAFVTDFGLAVVMRESDEAEAKALLESHPVLSKHKDRVWFVPPTFTNSISSTLIRKQISTDGSLYGLVHPKVEAYIKTKGLYGWGKVDGKDGMEVKKGGEGQYAPLFPSATTTKTKVDEGQGAIAKAEMKGE